MKAGAALLARAKRQVSEPRMSASRTTLETSEIGEPQKQDSSVTEPSIADVSFADSNQTDNSNDDFLLDLEDQENFIEDDASVSSDGPTSNGVSKPGKLAQRSQTTADVPEGLKDFVLNPPPLRLEAWSESPAGNFKVRGPSYLVDKKKIPSEPSVFKLLAVDLVKVEKLGYTGFCSLPNERVQKALKREEETGVKELPEFIFAVNLAVPGRECYHCVFYFGIDDMSELMTQETAFGRLASQFFFGPSDEFRSRTFKLIPRIVEGNVVVRKAVGSKPSILGKKLKQTYVKNSRFFEIILDIESCKMAQRIVKLSLGYARSLVVDMMFLLEGAGPAVLPERILGGVRMSRIDFKNKDGQRELA